jgi:hypothetical protein
MVEVYAVIERLWDFDSILVSPLLVVSIHSGYDSIALHKYIWHPPSESGFVKDVTRDGKLSYLDRIGFFQVGKSFPRGCAVLPLDTEFPTFGCHPVVSITVMRVDELVLQFDSFGFILLPVNNLIEE